MHTWAPIWSGIVDSSLWEEDGDVVKVFMTMLATKNLDQVCELDAYAIAKKCNFWLSVGSVDELRVLDIMKILASPDKRRKVAQEFDGRRIKAVKGGWLVLNGLKYREMVSKEMKKNRDRKSQAKFRKKQADLKRGIPQVGETTYVNALLNGASEEELDRLSDPGIKPATNGSSVLAPTTIVEVKAVPEKKLPEYDDGSGSEIMPPEGAGS